MKLIRDLNYTCQIASSLYNLIMVVTSITSTSLAHTQGLGITQGGGIRERKSWGSPQNLPTILRAALVCMAGRSIYQEWHLELEYTLWILHTTSASKCSPLAAPFPPCNVWLLLTSLASSCSGLLWLGDFILFLSMFCACFWSWSFARTAHSVWLLFHPMSSVWLLPFLQLSL